jgi:hypothetical protein
MIRFSRIRRGGYPDPIAPRLRGYIAIFDDLQMGMLQTGTLDTQSEI